MPTVSTCGVLGKRSKELSAPNRFPSVQQPPRISCHRRRIARDVDDPAGPLARDRLHGFLRNPGARRIDDDRVRSIAVPGGQELLDTVDGRADGWPLARVAAQVLAARAVPFHGGDAVVPRGAERDGEQPDACIEIEHRAFGRNRVEHRGDERGQQEAIRLEEGLGAARQFPFPGTARGQGGEGIADFRVLPGRRTCRREYSPCSR